MKLYLATLPVAGRLEEGTAIFATDKNGKIFLLITDYLLSSLDVTLPEVAHLPMYRCLGSQHLFFDRESLLLASAIKWADNKSSRFIFTNFKDTDDFSYPVSNATSVCWDETLRSQKFVELTKPTTRTTPLPWSKSC